MNVTRCFRVLFLAILAVSFPAPTVQSEIIDLDLSNLNPLTTTPQIINAFRSAEQFWDSRVLGYSNTIPVDIRPSLTGRLQITVNELDLGGGALANAGVATGVTSVLGGRNRAVASTSVMNFDPATLANFTEAEIRDVVIHEMAHALGFGTLWQANNLLQPIPPRGGILQYRGINARRTFAQEAGFNRRQVAFVPVELEGGGGTALGHWDDDNFFFNSQRRDNRVELLTGFFIPDTERFVSETTFASLVDLGYVVSGFNEDELIDFTFPQRPGFPITARRRNFFPIAAANQNLQSPNPTAVPEPSALMLLLAGMSATLLRRQRAA